MKLKLGRKSGAEAPVETVAPPPAGEVTADEATAGEAIADDGAGTAKAAVVADQSAGGAVVVDDGPVAASPPPEPAAWEPPAPSTGKARSSSASGVGGLFNRMYGDVGEQSATERDRQAAYEFQQALAPAMELLHASVPEASSPEEAARILEQSQGELLPDPKGGAYINGDAYETDARIYYRLLRRDYEKAPRPSEKRATSHHLHQVYGKLTGTKGW